MFNRSYFFSMSKLMVIGVKPILVFFILLPFVSFISGCKPAGSQMNGMPPPEVTTIAVQPKDVPVSFEYVGQTAGSRDVEVRARVTGIILKRNYREGSYINKGESMFSIDPAPFETALTKARAQLASGEARLEQAKRNRARLTSLYEVKAVSQRELDDAVAAEEVAQADVRLAQANVDEAKLNLGYTKVAAPISGITSRALRSEGNLISGPDVLLTVVSQINPIYVLFGISDEERLKFNREVQEGRLALPQDLEVKLKLADGSIYEKTGKMNFSGVRISDITGTSEARAQLPNPKGVLHPGQFVRVILSGAHRPQAILVPQRAVLEGPTGKFVYVVTNENKAEARPVEVGDWSGDAWIINSGLKPGENVIVDGVMRIGPGAPVRVAQPVAPSKS